LDPLFDRIEVCESVLGRAETRMVAKKLFDRVYLRTEVGKEDSRSYKIALLGPGADELELGEFSDRNEALIAGMRAARRAGLAFEEKPEGLMLLRLEAAELKAIPADRMPQESAWWQRPTALALVVANLVPVWGVLVAGWHILPVMLLFWMENLVVGAYTILKMLIARGGGAGPLELPDVFRTLGNLALCGFFTVHYGMFCLVHGIFVVFMFGAKDVGRTSGSEFSALPGLALDLAWRHGLVLALIALVVSHGVSFYLHYLKPRAYQDAVAGKLMMEPYKRVVILHVVILFGGFFAMSTGSGAVPLLLLIGLKTAVDLAAHRREHAMPHEREMRDYMQEHGHRYVRQNP
jgi:hypothetical protein